MFVVSRTVASSARATIAITYGGSKPGSHGCWLSVNAITVPRPETSTGFQERLRHEGQIGTGGWTSASQSVQPWIRSRPSAPEVQNHWLAGVSWGRGRTFAPRVGGWRGASRGRRRVRSSGSQRGPGVRRLAPVGGKGAHHGLDGERGDEIA